MENRSASLKVLGPLIWLLAILLPFGLLLVNIKHFAVDVPFFDEWIFMGQMLDRLKDSSLSFPEIFASHNEHRIASTVLTFFITLNFDAWNRVDAAFLNAFVALASFIVFIIVAWPALHKCRLYFSGSIVFICSALFFSAQALENWTWGFQIQWFELNLTILLALAFLSSITLGPVKLLLAILFGVIATLCTAGGLMVWPSGIAAILARNSSLKVKLISTSVWSICGAIVWKLYHQGIESKSLLLGVGGHLKEVSSTLLALVGAPIANTSISAAISFGILGLFLTIVFLPIFAVLSTVVKDQVLARFFRFQLVIVIFAFCNALAITLARFAMGGPQYVLEASRYTSVVVFIWIALISGISLIVCIGKWRASRVSALAALIAILACQFYQSYFQSVDNWTYRKFILSELQNALLSRSPDLIQKDPNSIEAIKRVGLYSQETLEKLRDNKLSLFAPMRINLSENVEPSISHASGYIDQYESNYDAENKVWLNKIAGWAVNPLDSSTSAARVLIYLDKNIIAAPLPFHPRLDVNLALNLQPDVKVAWSYEFSSSEQIASSRILVQALSKETGSFKTKKLNFSQE